MRHILWIPLVLALTLPWMPLQPQVAPTLEEAGNHGDLLIKGGREIDPSGNAGD